MRVYTSPLFYRHLSTCYTVDLGPISASKSSNDGCVCACACVRRVLQGTYRGRPPRSRCRRKPRRRRPGPKRRGRARRESSRRSGLQGQTNRMNKKGAHPPTHSTQLPKGPRVILVWSPSNEPQPNPHASSHPTPHHQTSPLHHPTFSRFLLLLRLPVTRSHIWL